MGTPFVKRIGSGNPNLTADLIPLFERRPEDISLAPSGPFREAPRRAVSPTMKDGLIP